MKTIDIFKALSNTTRLNILKWLKDPEKYFPPQGLHIPEGDSFENSVCVGSICDKAEISQSTISSYLDMMLRCGLLESRRFGKWTYYRRNEKTIKELADYICKEL
ncbi:MAG: ArsR/SmtB family transcription factor [Eubacterium sp.]